MLESALQEAETEPNLESPPDREWEAHFAASVIRDLEEIGRGGMGIVFQSAPKQSQSVRCAQTHSSGCWPQLVSSTIPQTEAATNWTIQTLFPIYEIGDTKGSTT
jgi:hypothetical protein